MRKTFLAISLVTLSAATAAWVWSARRSNQPRGVFLIVVDTLRPDRLSCYGYTKHATPNMDSLAELGTRFTNAHAAGSWTVPSMGAIMVGKYPTQLGLVELPVPPDHRFQWREHRRQILHKLPPHTRTLASVMGEAEFRTAGFVNQPALNYTNGFLQGFVDWFYPAKIDEIRQHDPAGLPIFQEWPSLKYANRSDAALVQAFDRWMGEHAKDRPFVWLHFLTPHRPYEPPPADMGAATEEEMKQLPPSDRYDAEIRIVDRLVGQVLQTIERTMGLDRALIVLVSDHGEAFGEHDMNEHGHSLHAEVVHVPLVIAGPRVAQGAVVQQRIRLLDLFPTIVELAGVKRPLPDGLEAVSFVPVLKGLEQPRPWYAEGMLYGSTERSLAIGRHRLMWDQQDDVYQLFDVVNDPGELHDLLADLPAEAGRLKSHLEAHAFRLQEDFDRSLREQLAAWGQRQRAAESEEELKALRSLGYVDE